MKDLDPMKLRGAECKPVRGYKGYNKIRREYKHGDGPKLAKKYGVDKSTILKIKNNVYWKTK